MTRHSLPVAGWAALGVYVGSLDARPEEQTSKRVLRESIGALYVADPDARSSHNHGFMLFVREGALMAEGVAAKKLELTGEAISVAENLANPILLRIERWQAGLSDRIRKIATHLDRPAGEETGCPGHCGLTVWRHAYLSGWCPHGRIPRRLGRQ